MTEKLKPTSAELLVRSRHQLTLIEEIGAKGPDDRVLMEAARNCALANQLRWALEDEHKAALAAKELRAKAHRDQVAEHSPQA
jgi:hypothetical protein